MRRRGRTRSTAPRTPSGQLSRAGKVERGSIGTRYSQARAILGPDDRARLEILVTRTPAELAEAGLLDLGKRGTVDPETAVTHEREALLRKAADAPNAAQRRDPIGRAWHEGLLDGQGVDPVALRDVGREYGYLYWHEYAEVDATIGGYTEMLGRGSVANVSKDPEQRRDAAGRKWLLFSALVDPMGHAVRDAIHRLCVDEMWFAEGPPWLDRLINTERIRRGQRVTGELERRGDRDMLQRACAALVRLAGQVKAERPSRRGGPNLAELTYRGEEVGQIVPMSARAINPAFLDDRGLLLPDAEIAEILRGWQGASDEAVAWASQIADDNAEKGR